MVVSLLNFGARVSSIKLPVNGQLEEMIVTYREPEAFIDDPFYLGATCGPVANRISNAQFEIGNKLYKVSANDGKNSLHGGENNFSNSYWGVDENTISEKYVKFILKTVDLERGYPGNNIFTVEYVLTESNELIMSYTGKTDKATPINMTNHVYFTLGQTSCLALNISVESSSFIERFDNGIPTGEIISTKALGVNVRRNHLLKDIINNSDYSQVCQEGGLDHSFILDNSEIEKSKAVLYSKNNGVKLNIFTDQPTIHVYTGNYLAEPLLKHAGVCLECQGFVDASNQEDFADIIYEKTDVYRSEIVYGFSVIHG